MEVGLDGAFDDSRLLLDAKGSMGGDLALLMDELAYGLILTTLDGRLLHANQAARHELDRFKFIGESGSLLQAKSEENARVLFEGLARVAEGKRSLISLATEEGPTLSLAVVPLREDKNAVATKAALLFARAAVCESLMLCFFARSHGLTTTEEHVLGILCQGYSAPEIAAQMKVAVSTVRSHVRSLCAKTRSSGVRELVNRVAVLPPVAPSMGREQMH